MLQLALPHLLRPKDMLHLSCFTHCWRLVAAVGQLPVRMKGSRQHGVLFGECFWQAHLQSEQTVSQFTAAVTGCFGQHKKTGETKKIGDHLVTNYRQFSCPFLAGPFQPSHMSASNPCHSPDLSLTE